MPCCRLVLLQPNSLYGRFATVANGTLYFNCQNRRLYAADPRTGDIKWKWPDAPFNVCGGLEHGCAHKRVLDA